MNKIKAKQLLFKVIESLEENNIDYFLEAGTLLGAIRNKEFIKYDKDIDIGTTNNFFDDYNKFQAFLASLYKRGLKVPLIRGNWSIKIKGDDSLHVDIDRYFLNKKKDIYYCIDLSKQHIRYFPMEIISERNGYTFLGKEVKILLNYKSYLNILYGNDWKKPKKNFYTNNNTRKYNLNKRLTIEHIITVENEEI